jgi:hypothetical protein
MHTRSYKFTTTVSYGRATQKSTIHVSTKIHHKYTIYCLDYADHYAQNPNNSGMEKLSVIRSSD